MNKPPKWMALKCTTYTLPSRWRYILIYIKLYIYIFIQGMNMIIFFYILKILFLSWWCRKAWRLLLWSWGVTQSEATFSADLGGSRKYSRASAIMLRTEVEKGSMSTWNAHGSVDPKVWGKLVIANKVECEYYYLFNIQKYTLPPCWKGNWQTFQYQWWV